MGGLTPRGGGPPPFPSSRIDVSNTGPTSSGPMVSCLMFGDCDIL